MKHQSTRHQGFTLIEVIVVIAILGILASIVLPGVQAAREAARRASCQNNLKQIGLAITSYESIYQVYPNTSGVPDYNGNSYSILHLKQYSAFAYSSAILVSPTIFNSVNFSTPINDYLMFTGSANDGSANGTINSLAIDQLVCPSDYRTIGAQVNYRFNLGIDRWYPLHQSSLDGPLLPYTCTGAASITDGLSHTVAASEALTGSNNPVRYDSTRDFLIGGLGLPYTADQSLLLCTKLSATSMSYVTQGGKLWLVGTLSHTCYNHIGPPNGKMSSCLLGNNDPAPGIVLARSGHMAGVNVLMMDGAVKFAGNSINKQVWRSIGTGTGGELYDAQF